MVVVLVREQVLVPDILRVDTIQQTIHFKGHLWFQKTHGFSLTSITILA